MINNNVHIIHVIHVHIIHVIHVHILHIMLLVNIMYLWFNKE